MKPFAILYETEDGKAFKAFETWEEADAKAKIIARVGYAVTVFDYDMETDQYLSFYSL